MRTCRLYLNNPEHPFDRALCVEAEQTASELTRGGFPIHVEAHHARGDEAAQLRQIEADRRAASPGDVLGIVPINQDGAFGIVGDILATSADTVCVFLQQSVPRLLQGAQAKRPRRLFSVAADQVEIGRIQARQLAAILPGRAGNLLYVQGRENSYGTRHRTKGLQEELARTPGITLRGYRVYGDWSPESVRPAIDGWVRLGYRLDSIQAAAAQNDEMALALAAVLRERAHAVPVTGVDGLKAGRRAVDEGTLAATVVQPLGVGHALRVYRDLAAGKPEGALMPPDGNILELPRSYPALDELRR